ncbi:FkbM family methyltransferase [Actinosynnema pretiosum subsp. pretiosum]|uniref:FkbM family methyltransferase n=1 Tax=Actinosynnema pretiosum subsp. pretiosum TaxID=103721 RepID=A0AA45R6U0_9PSEU|nr:FkbM family methyltransferase [Actinosynnema pretiosum subsp. pretiosum]
MKRRPVRVVHTGHSPKLGSYTATEFPSNPETAPVLIGCTVATAAELPAVKALSSSFLAHHPEARFLALVVDAAPGTSGPGLVTPADLGVTAEELAVLATGCTAAELCGVLRPLLLEQLLGQGVPVLCLDPWVRVLAPVTEQVLAAAEQGPLVLLPRSLRPLPDDGLRPTPTELLRTGVFDPGFLVVAPGAEPFLRTLAEQLRRTPDATKAVLDMAPALVKVHVLRDATIGLSAWNAAQRPVHRLDDGALSVMGEPLRTVHFAGFDPNRPWLLSARFADRPRVLLSEHPLLADLCTAYRADLVRAGHTAQRVPYGFGQLADGTPIPDRLRADYRAASRTGTPHGPFGTPRPIPVPPQELLLDGVPDLADGQPESVPPQGEPGQAGPAQDGLVESADAPTAAVPAASDTDAPTRAALTVVPDGGAPEAATPDGSAPEGSAPEDSVPAGQPEADAPESAASDPAASTDPTTATATAAASDADDRPHTPPPAFGDDRGAAFLAWACEPVRGLHGSTRWSVALWQGDLALRHEFPDPFGEDSAAFRDWCATTGVASGRLPVPAVPGPRAGTPALIDQLGVTVLGDDPAADLLRAAAKASGLPTGDGYPVVLRVGDEPVPADRFLVDYLASDQPPQSLDATELWTPSEATRAAVERAGGPVVRVLPLPTAEADAGVPEPHEGLLLGALADHSIDRSGNVLGVVAAFLAAFPDRDDVRLRITVTGADEHPEAAERLRLATATDPRVELADDFRPVDCLVSLHRGGADDRVAAALADVAATGTPVMTARHGAVPELFDKATALFVPCRQGVEPDADAAVKLLRAIADEPEAVAAIGAAGREHVRATRSTAQVAEVLRERVEHAYRGWRARRAAAKPAPVADPLQVLQTAKHALLREPDVSVASRIPMAPQLRKVVLRVLDHHDNHMRDVLGGMVDGVERTVAELVRRQDEVTTGIGLGELEVLRSEVEQQAERQGEHSDQLIALDDSVVRVRADMAGQGRRLRDIEDALVAEAAKRAKQGEAAAQRIDKLAVALERTLDRIDRLESRVVDVLRDRDHRLDAGVRSAAQAQATADALRRVVVREHERHSASAPSVRSSLVLTEVGLLRLPADDAFMLPFLSSNGTWEAELSELIDSVVEPDGIFLDVGAYAGYQTVRMLSRMGTTGAVVAVEPCPSAVELLRHNVQVNLPQRVAERLVVVPAAAWESAGELAAQPSLTGGVSVSPLPPDAPADAPRVRATRLDKELEAVPGLAGLKLSVVRVDAPGRGHRALAGLVRLLRRDRPHVFLEFSATATEALGDDPVRVLAEFRVWGYDLVPVATREPAAPEAVVAAMEGLRSVPLWLRPRPVPAKGVPPQAAPTASQRADQAI